jgi:SAM-dependent methyltransferase
MITDDYAPAAPFYDLFAAATENPDVLTRVERYLSRADPDAGPILDIGAGTGRSTELAARAVPTARVLAVEPSPSMRIGLFTRIAACEDIRRRVTVVSARIQEVELPPRLSGGLCLGALGHFSPPERRALFASLAQRLAPGAPFVVQVESPDEVAGSAQKCYAIVSVGDVAYELWGRLLEADGDRARWLLEYRQNNPDGSCTSTLLAFDTFVASVRTVVTDARAAGLNVQAVEDSLAVLGGRGAA